MSLTGSQTKYMGRSKSPHKGFTLIEILVSVAIFTVVMTIAIGALLTLNNTLQKAKLLRASIENVNIALEGISKRIRTGSGYVCLSAAEVQGITPFSAATSRDCNVLGVIDEGFGLAFFSNELDKYVAYRLRNGQLQVATSVKTNPNIAWVNSVDGTQTLDVVTSSEVLITRVRFYVSGTSLSDDLQPKVTILISARAELPGKTFLNTQFNLQTTVSQRIFEI